VRRPGIALWVILLVAGLFVASCEEAGGPGVGNGSTADVFVEASAEPSVDWYDEESPEPSPTPPPPAIELRAAINDGKVSIALHGIGLERVQLTLTPKIETSIRVVVNPGTMLLPKASGTQTMVVIDKAVITLEPEVSVDVGLDVACAQMHDAMPESSDTFRVASSRAPADLLKLLRLPAFANEDFRIKQFAIWTITDNPSRSGYVGLTSWVESGGPTKAEFARIAELFDQADIAAGHYRALR
jgi:hypothetical protein